MRILVTGSNGLLGQKIIKQLIKRKVDFLATSKGENRNSKCPGSNYNSLDITNEAEVQELLSVYRPTAIINTAAMTNVDACEADPENCQKINVDAARYLFEAAQKTGTHFIHLSTDFVFDGQKGPYREEDERNPLSIYARSKFDSENLLLESNYDNWSILRTIIVFGEGENLSRSNIVLWAKDALASGKPLTIVDDQFRAPTWADDLAWACIRTAELNAKGIFHIGGPQVYSIYDLVKAIANFYNLPTTNVSATSSENLNQKAPRPPRTGFVLDKARRVLGYNPLSLEQCLAQLSG